MLNYKTKQRLRLGLIATLILIGLVSAIGPILYVMMAKPVITDGPTMGPRTH